MSSSAWTGRHRLFVAPEAVDGAFIHFSRDHSHQLVRVLRVAKQEPVVVLTGDGQEYIVELREIDARACVGEIVERQAAAGISRLTVALYQALIPRERFELALTKGTEVGIGRFVPLITQRVVAKLDDRDWPRRKERLESLAREASEQSERGQVPTIGAPRSFGDAVQEACSVGPTLVAWERGGEAVSRSEIQQIVHAVDPNVSILVGPEGGFTTDEIALARESGARLIWLGPRILRAETAGLVLASLLLYESGDLGIAP